MSIVGRRRAATTRLSNGEPGFLSVGDAVSIYGADTGVRADATDLNKMPAIGIAVSVRGTHVVVQLDSVIDLSFAVSPGKTYWVDPTTPGAITDIPPDFSGGLTQIIGVGKSSDSLLIRIDPAGFEV